MELHIASSPFFRVNLRRLILFLTLLSAVIIQLNAFYASYSVQRQLLIDNTLASNRAYAAKLADSIDHFLHAAQQQLAYSAGLLAENFEDANLLLAEADRLRLQTDSFNSVVFVDASGKVVGTSPDTLGILGKKLDSPGATEALKVRRPIISQPYISVTGNLLVFISHPVTDIAGQYLGYIGGTIYLKQKSILYNLLGEHHYRDGSYLYVVAQNRRLLYHPDAARLGEKVGPNLVVDAVLRDETGDMRINNSEGVDMLAGFAIVPMTHWGVVAQRPTEVTLAPMRGLMFSVMLNTLPMVIVTLLFILWFAKIIARPLRELADSAQEMDRAATAERIKDVNSWYFESSEIKRALLVGFKLLHYKINKLVLDVQTDPLTGLHNRRGLNIALDLMQSTRRNFAVISLDIDHFKSVNDTYGHDAGDAVLQEIAAMMQKASRGDDVVCRLGGEEFLILLPGIDAKIAAEIAERLRRQVEQSRFGSAGQITISLGVAQWCVDSGDVEAVLKVADNMLYEAKRSGRNRVVVGASLDCS